VNLHVAEHATSCNDSAEVSQQNLILFRCCQSRSTDCPA